MCACPLSFFNSLAQSIGVRGSETTPEMRTAAAIVTAKESSRETLDGWAFGAALDQALGLGFNAAQEEIRRVRQTKPEDVSRVAKEFLKQPVICIVTSDPAAAEAVRK